MNVQAKNKIKKRFKNLVEVEKGNNNKTENDEKWDINKEYLVYVHEKDNISNKTLNKSNKDDTYNIPNIIINQEVFQGIPNNKNLEIKLINTEENIKIIFKNYQNKNDLDKSGVKADIENENNKILTKYPISISKKIYNIAKKSIDLQQNKLVCNVSYANEENFYLTSVEIIINQNLSRKELYEMCEYLKGTIVFVSTDVKLQGSDIIYGRISKNGLKSDKSRIMISGIPTNNTNFIIKSSKGNVYFLLEITRETFFFSNNFHFKIDILLNFISNSINNLKQLNNNNNKLIIILFSRFFINEKTKDSLLINNSNNKNFCKTINFTYFPFVLGYNYFFDIYTTVVNEKINNIDPRELVLFLNEYISLFIYGVNIKNLPCEYLDYLDNKYNIEEDECFGIKLSDSGMCNKINMSINNIRDNSYYSRNKINSNNNSVNCAERDFKKTINQLNIYKTNTSYPKLDKNNIKKQQLKFSPISLDNSNNIRDKYDYNASLKDILNYNNEYFKNKQYINAYLSNTINVKLKRFKNINYKRILRNKLIQIFNKKKKESAINNNKSTFNNLKFLENNTNKSINNYSTNYFYNNINFSDNDIIYLSSSNFSNWLESVIVVSNDIKTQNTFLDEHIGNSLVVISSGESYPFYYNSMLEFTKELINEVGVCLSMVFTTSKIKSLNYTSNSVICPNLKLNSSTFNYSKINNMYNLYSILNDLNMLNNKSNLLYNNSFNFNKPLVKERAFSGYSLSCNNTNQIFKDIQSSCSNNEIIDINNIYKDKEIIKKTSFKNLPNTNISKHNYHNKNVNNSNFPYNNIVNYNNSSNINSNNSNIANSNQNIIELLNISHNSPEFIQYFYLNEMENNCYNSTNFFELKTKNKNISINKDTSINNLSIIDSDAVKINKFNVLNTSININSNYNNYLLNNSDRITNAKRKVSYYSNTDSGYDLLLNFNSSYNLNLFDYNILNSKNISPSEFYSILNINNYNTITSNKKTCKVSKKKSNENKNKNSNNNFNSSNLPKGDEFSLCQRKLSNKLSIKIEEEECYKIKYSNLGFVNYEKSNVNVFDNNISNYNSFNKLNNYLRSVYYNNKLSINKDYNIKQNSNKVTKIKTENITNNNKGKKQIKEKLNQKLLKKLFSTSLEQDNNTFLLSNNCSLAISNEVSNNTFHKQSSTNISPKYPIIKEKDYEFNIDSSSKKISFAYERKSNNKYNCSNMLAEDELNCIENLKAEFEKSVNIYDENIFAVKKDSVNYFTYNSNSNSLSIIKNNINNNNDPTNNNKNLSVSSNPNIIEKLEELNISEDLNSFVSYISEINIKSIYGEMNEKLIFEEKNFSPYLISTMDGEVSQVIETLVYNRLNSNFQILKSKIEEKKSLTQTKLIYLFDRNFIHVISVEDENCKVQLYLYSNTPKQNKNLKENIINVKKSFVYNYINIDAFTNTYFSKKCCVYIGEKDYDYWSNYDIKSIDIKSNLNNVDLASQINLLLISTLDDRSNNNINNNKTNTDEDFKNNTNINNSNANNINSQLNGSVSISNLNNTCVNINKNISLPNNINNNNNIKNNFMNYHNLKNKFKLLYNIIFNYLSSSYPNQKRQLKSLFNKVEVIDDFSIISHSPIFPLNNIPKSNRNNTLLDNDKDKDTKESFSLIIDNLQESAYNLNSNKEFSSNNLNPITNYSNNNLIKSNINSTNNNNIEKQNNINIKEEENCFSPTNNINKEKNNKAINNLLNYKNLNLTKNNESSYYISSNKAISNQNAPKAITLKYLSNINTKLMINSIKFDNKRDSNDNTYLIYNENMLKDLAFFLGLRYNNSKLILLRKFIKANLKPLRELGFYLLDIGDDNVVNSSFKKVKAFHTKSSVVQMLINSESFLNYFFLNVQSFHMCKIDNYRIVLINLDNNIMICINSVIKNNINSSNLGNSQGFIYVVHNENINTLNDRVNINNINSLSNINNDQCKCNYIKNNTKNDNRYLNKKDIYHCVCIDKLNAIIKHIAKYINCLEVVYYLITKCVDKVSNKNSIIINNNNNNNNNNNIIFNENLIIDNNSNSNNEIYRSSSFK